MLHCLACMMETAGSPDLSLLRRIDPCIADILSVAPGVALHQLDLHTHSWHRKNERGSLFVVKRNAPERFQLIIMNRSNRENLVEDILGISEYVDRSPYLIYRNKGKMVRALEFTEPETCLAVCKVLQRILSAYMSIPPKPTIPPSKSKAKQLAVNSSSVSEDGEANNCSSDEMGSPESVLSRERTAPVTASAVEQLISSLPGNQQLLSADHPPRSSAPFDNYFQNHVRPSTLASVMMSSECGVRPLTLFIPPILPHSVIPNSANAPTTIVREQLREELAKLVMDDSFVDMLFEEILKRHLR